MVGRLAAKLDHEAGAKLLRVHEAPLGKDGVNRRGIEAFDGGGIDAHHGRRGKHVGHGYVALLGCPIKDGPGVVLHVQVIGLEGVKHLKALGGLLFGGALDLGHDLAGVGVLGGDILAGKKHNGTVGVLLSAPGHGQ